MRVIKKYVFKIGTKFKFDRLPDLIRSYLDSLNLTSRKFFYYLEDLVYLPSTPDTVVRSACGRMFRACPSLGDICAKQSEGLDTLWITNIDREAESSDEIIRPLLSKIYRSYGFTESRLYYFDIDFFGRVVPMEMDDANIEDRPVGSGITIEKSVSGDNYITLSVDVLNGKEILDPTPYVEAMKQLLPGVKANSGMIIYLSPEEKQAMADIHTNAIGELGEAVEFFMENLPADYYGIWPAKYSISSKLKKLAAKYGYEYANEYQNLLFSLSKRTERGNLLAVGVISSPSRYHLEISVTYEGLGFKQYLGSGNYAPAGQKEFNELMDDLMDAVSRFESTLLSQLDSKYPDTPAWYEKLEILV